ncbi:MAG: anaerobic glycerol-3-phosphate dehydrogenase subunit C [Anaerolineales bacterium]|nr:MAG: anaerobic glycerol-3-phosphate dehydrogenase subunit C [Anaerolineales bacterium]
MLKDETQATLLQFPGLTTDQCIKCNICNVACPVMAVSGDFLGPKAVGPQAERFRHPRLPIPDASVSLCSGCGTCSRVCPQGVAIAEMNTQAKARLVAQHGAPLRDQLLARPQMLGQWMRPFAGVANRLLKSNIVRWSLDRSFGIHQDAPLPPFSGKTFRSGVAQRCMDAPPEDLGEDTWVAYFHGCSTNHYEPRIGELAIAVLEKLGCRVIVPPQVCCGLPLQSNGLFKAARRYAEKNTQLLRPFIEKGIPIVGTSSSCTLQLKHETRSVLGLNGRDCEELALGTRDIFEWIVESLWETVLKMDLAPVQALVLYHAPCQLKSHWMGTPALQVLRLIPGLNLQVSQAECCGIAGTYGVKSEKYAIARDVGQNLFHQVEDVQPDWVVTDSETCRWWIEQHTGVTSIHPIEILASAMNLTPLEGI